MSTKLCCSDYPLFLPRVLDVWVQDHEDLSTERAAMLPIFHKLLLLLVGLGRQVFDRVHLGGSEKQILSATNMILIHNM